jgi:hypothetical protein
MKRVILTTSGLALAALGLWLLPTSARPLRFPPSSQDLVRLSGPLRVLPVPLAWQAFGEAMQRQDEALTLSRGRWLISLMPEAEGLYAAMAWQLAYNLAAVSADPEERARRVREALILLEEGMRERPELVDLPALAGFLLQDRARGTGMEAALREVLGESPFLRASRYLEVAARLGNLSGGHSFLLLRLSVRLVELGERHFAAQVLETLAQSEDDADVSGPLKALAVALRAEGPLHLSPELCTWVLKTEPFSRKPRLWPCR